jgi:DNA mismatch repair protein MutS
MSFYSILFETPQDRPADDSPAPAFFADLNCDQIVAAITSGKQEYSLTAFFQARLDRLGAIRYRQEAMQELQSTALHALVESFAQSMRDMRDHLGRARTLHYDLQRQAWFLDACAIYCEATSSLRSGLDGLALKSRGFIGFRDHLRRYCAGPAFRTLAAQAKELRVRLDAVACNIAVRGSSFTVRRFENEADYSAEIEATFDRFKQGAVKDHRVKFSTSEEMNHIEAKILEFTAKLHPDIFASLKEFCAGHGGFAEPTIAAFDREVQFYIAYLNFISVLREAGLPFCYPRLVAEAGEIYGLESFDVALAQRLVGEGKTVVRNDFRLSGDERILVVSGPNQGGKTTFARAFGQLHYLAGIGCPVPGRSAQLLHFDRLFTLFEKEERVENLRGKLEDDLLRMRDILMQATARSVFILNEVFNSTTIHDETLLSKNVTATIIRRGSVAVWVTFVDDLASFGPQTVSMASTVAADDPARRTFRIERRPADGLAYAMSIAERHGLSYAAILQRVKP